MFIGVKAGFMKWRSISALACVLVLLNTFALDHQPVQAKEETHTIRRLRVGGVSGFFPKALHKVEPVYPRLARQRRIQGTVLFEILISEEGSVSSARLLSGHPLLVTPAREAVMHWHYEPPRFKGESLEVITTAAVTFTLPTIPSPTNGPTLKAI